MAPSGRDEDKVTDRYEELREREREREYQPEREHCATL